MLDLPRPKPIAPTVSKYDAIRILCERQKIEFRFNVISGRTQISREGEDYRDMEERDYSDIVVAADLAGAKQVNSIAVKHYTESAYYAPIYNPFDDKFRGLPEWNHVDLVSVILSALDIKGDEREKDRVWKTITCWLQGVIHQSLRTSRNEICLTLVGEQGAGKTSFLRNLFERSGFTDYYCELKAGSFKNSADLLIRTSRMILCNIDEYDKLSPRIKLNLNQIITSQVDADRAPYGRTDRTWKRRASFAGTANGSHGLLTDSSGERRYDVIEVGEVDNEFWEHIDIDQIWAGAMWRIKRNLPHWLSFKEAQELSKRNMDNFGDRTYEMELIDEYFRPSANAVIGENGIIKPQRMSVIDIMSQFSPQQAQKVDHRRLGQALKRAGYKSTDRPGRGKLWHVYNSNIL